MFTLYRLPRPLRAVGRLRSALPSFVEYQRPWIFTPGSRIPGTVHEKPVSGVGRRSQLDLVDGDFLPLTGNAGNPFGHTVIECVLASVNDCRCRCSADCLRTGTASVTGLRPPLSVTAFGFRLVRSDSGRIEPNRLQDKLFAC
jgi:hypothetical protein